MKTTEQLKAGMRVKVDAHGQHEEDFSGIIQGVDNDNYLVHVRAPDGELYGCTMAFVREWPEEQTAKYPLAGQYTILQFNELPGWARDTIFDLEHKAAAAPELLEALKTVEFHCPITNGNEIDGQLYSVSLSGRDLQKLRAAIAKAEGGAS